MFVVTAGESIRKTGVWHDWHRGHQSTSIFPWNRLEFVQRLSFLVNEISINVNAEWYFDLEIFLPFYYVGYLHTEELVFVCLVNLTSASSLLLEYFNGWQLTKMKKSIPDMSLP